MEPDARIPDGEQLLDPWALRLNCVIFPADSVLLKE